MGIRTRIKRILFGNEPKTISSNITYEILIKDEKRFDNKVILVTGGSGAIGSAICLKLAVQGALVGVSGRNLSKINQVINTIKNMYPSAKLAPLFLDVLDASSIQDAIEKFIVENGRIDGFINNAGGGARSLSKPLYEQDVDVIDNVLNTNLRGSILCARIVSQHMVTQGYGSIVNMSSVMGLQGKETMVDYSASKSGILGFTKSLALELGTHNITVNCVSPGMVRQTSFDRGEPHKTTRTNALGRFGYTDEVANLVSFLLSDEARYITGENIVIDGGRSIGLK